MKRINKILVKILMRLFAIKYVLILLFFTTFIFCNAWSQIVKPVVDKTQIKNIEKKDNSPEPKGHGNIGDILKNCEPRRLVKPKIEKTNEVDIDEKFAIKLALVRAGKQKNTAEKIFSIIPIYNLEENLIGYDIDIILDGRTWPDYMTVANEWRSFCEEQAKNVRVKNYKKLRAPSEGRKTQSDVYTAYNISATYDTSPIRAKRGGVSNFYATGWIAQEIASDVLGVREPILRKVYMVGPLERAYLFENSNRAIIVEGQAPWSYYEYESYIEFSKTDASKRKEKVYDMIKENGLSPAEVIKNIRNENRIKAEEILKMSFIPKSEHFIDGYDSWFEPFEWHYGCSPTSGAMVLNYWENRSWFGKLNYWFFREYDNIENEWDCHVSTLHESMADYMDTNSSGGTTPTDIYPGMLNYANDKGYSFSGGPNWTGYTLYWHWAAITDEIDNDYPFVWTNDWYASGRHSVAAVGYDDTDMIVLFYNTWGYGSGNVINGCSYSGALLDFSFGAAPHPGGPVYYDVKIESPDGYQVYGNCGTSGTYYVGSTIDISWDNFSTPGNHVNIWYSTDGGLVPDDWTFIANTYDDGSYNWTIPSDAITVHGRICIQQYSSTSNLVSSDGSYGDFKIEDSLTSNLVLSPTSHNFGDQQVNTSSSYFSFTLENIGNATAQGEIYLTGSNANQFYIHPDDDGNFTLSAGNIKNVRVRFSPTSTGSKDATLFVNGTSGTNDVSATLSGNGTSATTPNLVLSPTSHNFGNQQVNTSSSYFSFTLENTGNATAQGEIYLTGSNANQFYIHPDDDGNFTLSAGNIKNVRVRFSPTSTGSKDATLFVNGTSGTNDVSATLSGNGIDVQDEILVVDHDLSDDGYTDCWPYYETALIVNSIDYTYYQVSSDLVTPDLSTMQMYDCIVWFSGECWGYYGDDCMTPSSEGKVASYLDGGGSLFFSGQDYLWASYPNAGTLVSGQFPHDYLGLTSVSQDMWYIEDPDVIYASGVAGSVADGYTFTASDIFTASREGLWIDQIFSYTADAMGLFQVDSPSPLGICAVQKDTGVYRSIFTTLAFAAIDDPTIQNNLLGDIVNWLTGVVSVDNDPVVHNSITNSPNPFNNSTTFSFALKQDAQVTVDIYNIKGQLVKNISNEYMISGIHSVTWNGADNSYNEVPIGLYLTRIVIDYVENIHKVMLIR